MLVWHVRPAKLVVLEQMNSVAGFLSAFSPRGSKMRLYGVLWLSRYLCAKHLPFIVSLYILLIYM